MFSIRVRLDFTFFEKKKSYSRLGLGFDRLERKERGDQCCVFFQKDLTPPHFPPHRRFCAGSISRMGGGVAAGVILLLYRWTWEWKLTFYDRGRQRDFRRLGESINLEI